MRIGVDVQFSTPFDHALENRYETFESFDPDGFLLDGCRPQFDHLPALRDFRQNVHQSFEDVGCRQIAVVVDVEIDYALSVGTYARQRLHNQPVVVESRSWILQNVQKYLAEKHLHDRVKTVSKNMDVAAKKNK